MKMGASQRHSELLSQSGDSIYSMERNCITQPKAYYTQICACIKKQILVFLRAKNAKTINIF